MNHVSLLALGTMLCASVFVAVRAEPMEDTPKEFKDQEAMVVKLFKAYNKDDAKGVFEDYVEVFKNMPDALWGALYKMHKDKYGNYKSHTFVKEGSSTAEENGILMIQVEFEKAKAVKVGINFGMENKKWKIQQVTFDVKQ